MLDKGRYVKRMEINARSQTEASVIKAAQLFITNSKDAGNIITENRKNDVNCKQKLQAIRWRCEMDTKQPHQC